MALKPLPALPKISTGRGIAGGGYVPGGSSTPVGSAIGSAYAALQSQPGGPGTNAYSASGGYYDPTRSIFVPASSSVPNLSSTAGGGGAGDSSTTGGGGGAGGAGGGSGSSGYLSELMGDPMYQSALSAFNNAISGGQASLADQIKQQVIRSGYDPTAQMPASLAAQWGGAIDPATVAAANANPMSTRAQLQLQLQQGQNDLNYQLAARGIERSGAFATGNTGLQNQYDTQSYGAMNSLLDAINQGSQNYAQFAANQLLARNSAYESVAQRLAMQQYGANYGNQNNPGGLSMSDIASALPQDTNNQLGKAILGTPNFDYDALSQALGVPSMQNIASQYLPGYTVPTTTKKAK